MNTRLMKTYEDLTFKAAKDNDVKRENANIDGDTAMGTMLKYGSAKAPSSSTRCTSSTRKHAKAHREGRHPHPRPGFPDPDHHLLPDRHLRSCSRGGFCTGHGFLREPNDIHSYSALACIAIQSNQNDQHGGQSIPNFDYGHGPGRAPRPTVKRTVQPCQGARAVAGSGGRKDAVKGRRCRAVEQRARAWSMPGRRQRPT